MKSWREIVTSGASPLSQGHEYLGFVCDVWFGVRELSLGGWVVNPNFKYDIFISAKLMPKF